MAGTESARPRIGHVAIRLACQPPLAQPARPVAPDARSWRQPPEDQSDSRTADAAVESVSSTSASASTLEGYYQYNWNRPPDRVNLLRAYDTRANTFGIQQAALVVESAPDVEAGRRYGAARRPAVRPGDRDGAGQPRQRAAARRVSPHLAGLRHLRVPCRPRPADRLRQVRVECSATRPTTPRTTTSSRAPICSTSCRSTTPACASACPSTTR